jgi:hypothetical protein
MVKAALDRCLVSCHMHSMPGWLGEWRAPVVVEEEEEA